MRRLIAVSAFALFLAAPVWAQHHGGGAGHSGFSGGHFGGFSNHSSFSGGHSGSAVSRGVAHSPISARHSVSHGPIIVNSRSRGRFHGRGFRNNCHGYACRNYGYAYPWLSAGYYDPWWWNSTSSYDDDYDYDQNRAVAGEMNEQSIDLQRMLRQEQADGDQDAYARRPADTRPASQSETVGTSFESPTVLVFRDRHQQEVENYAIVGQTLWNFSAHRTEKISISRLDLTATEKANDDRGVTFRVPAPAEAQ